MAKPLEPATDLHTFLTLGPNGNARRLFCESDHWLGIGRTLVLVERELPQCRVFGSIAMVRPVVGGGEVLIY